ncbi:ovarian cancer G-protein coupled receptor 1-like [Notechis scutatus]|uniref:Ovarian cancer G-protein coupled receptor 1-like n=1 Tax=Notechis scutatus TaxID=8663 RepID=A0A6J1VZ82_9SAUR|nr:ovarian cancer G-protein coupled receptor 1-like [Notechis scutatus]
MDNSSNSECPFMPLNATKIFKIPMYSVILAFGLPLNILAFGALIYQLKKSVVLSVYIMNLVVAHLLQILTLPFWMHYSHNNHEWNLGKATCFLVGVAFRSNFYAKNNFLCLIAMERYLGLVHPLRFHQTQTVLGAVKISILVWLLVLMLCTIGIGLQIRTFEHGGKTCVDSSTLNPDYAMFRVSIVAFSFIIPFFLMAFFHISVLFKVRQVVSLEKRLKTQISGFVSLLIMVFFLLFTPYQVISYYRYLLEVMTPSAAVCESLRSIFIYEHATLCLSLLDNILDPLFYNVLLKDMQTNFRKCLFRRTIRKDLSSEVRISRMFRHHENTGPLPDP